MNSAVYEQIYYSFKYDDSGYRTSKTYLGQTTNYYYDGGLLLGEERGGNVFIYLYDTNGSPIGMQYHAANTAKSVWESYWFEKNLQGDIITTIESRNSKYFDGKS